MTVLQCAESVGFIGNPASAAVWLQERGLTTKCPRCEGTGRFLTNADPTGICYKCNGLGHLPATDDMIVDGAPLARHVIEKARAGTIAGFDDLRVKYGARRAGYNALTKRAKAQEDRVSALGSEYKPLIIHHQKMLKWAGMMYRTRSRSISSMLMFCSACDAIESSNRALANIK